MRIALPWILELTLESNKSLYKTFLVDNETDSHLYFIGTKHPEFVNFPFEKGSIIIDPWRYIPENEDYKVISIGNNLND